MDKTAYLAALRLDTGRIAELARGDLSPSVPGCPGWSVGDLVLHLGGVYEWVIAVLTSDSVERSHIEALYERVVARREQRSKGGLARSPEVVSWFEEQAQLLLGNLDSRAAGDAVWTWWDRDQTAGFWQRRMAQETAVHLWDVQSASGLQEPIDRDMAADGIDEALFVHLPAEYAESAPDGRDETYHFHCNDGDGEWLVRFTSDVRVTREHAKGDLAFSGTAYDLLLFLWRRIPVEKIAVFGDIGGLDRYFELLRVDS